MNQTQQSGSKAYLYSVVLVAVLGGLLFGYDTAVISGAEKGLQAFFMEASDFEYNDLWHGFTSASALIGCIIGSLLSGYLSTRLGRKKSLIIAGLLFFVSALGSMEPEFLFFKHGEPLFSLLLMFNFYRIIGGIGVAEFPGFPGCCELQKLYLDRSARGRGLGYEMIRHIESFPSLRATSYLSERTKRPSMSSPILMAAAKPR